MSAPLYYLLTTPGDEVAGTEAAIRASLALFRQGGGTRFYISGPFLSPPATRPAHERRQPYFERRVCAVCFRHMGEHLGTDFRCPEGSAQP